MTASFPAHVLPWPHGRERHFQFAFVIENKPRFVAIPKSGKFQLVPPLIVNSCFISWFVWKPIYFFPLKDILLGCQLTRYKLDMYNICTFNNLYFNIFQPTKLFGIWKKPFYSISSSFSQIQIKGGFAIECVINGLFYLRYTIQLVVLFPYNPWIQYLTTCPGWTLAGSWHLLSFNTDITFN